MGPIGVTKEANIKIRNIIGFLFLKNIVKDSLSPAKEERKCLEK